MAWASASPLGALIRGCANFSGIGSLLTSCGTSSVVADDLVLTASNLPTNNFGIAFMGATQAMLPFGNGILCRRIGGHNLRLVHDGGIVLGSRR